MNPSSSGCQICHLQHNCKCHLADIHKPRIRIEYFASHQRPSRPVAQHQPKLFYGHPEDIPGPPAAGHDGPQVVNTQDIRIQATKEAFFTPSSSPLGRKKDVYACSPNSNSELAPQAWPGAINGSGVQTGASQSSNLGNRRTEICSPQPYNPCLYGAEAWSRRIANFTNNVSTNTTTTTTCLPENVGQQPRKRAVAKDPQQYPEGSQEAKKYAKRSRPD
ncbi:hypothetical protein DID88_006078 [Monilinia fructigena]|uniref:Uncharacterized protein n=1 Tax=Monilinia fructigena TaxID=38457 RepID=A0A395J1K5_9HELO|nr:hypothetical protein DID88_006078 [Monilinia fructigena]